MLKNFKWVKQYFKTSNKKCNKKFYKLKSLKDLKNLENFARENLCNLHLSGNFFAQTDGLK
jgi:hypothetical protein